VLSQEDIDFEMEYTMPPGVEKRIPEVHRLCFDGPSDMPFSFKLAMAARYVYRDGDTGLLDALRQKWPEAVEDAWPKVSEAALRKLRAEEHPAPMSAERKPARVAAMA